MKISITRQIAVAAVFISCLALFQNCGPAKVSTSEADVAGSSADLGSSTPDSPGPMATPTPPPLAVGPAVMVSKTSIDFGSVPFDDQSTVQSFSIKNTGDAAVTLSRNIVSDDFGFANGNLANVCTTSLAPGQSCNLGVRFFPSSTGDFTGMVRINSNAPDSPHLIQLTGKGTFF